MSKKTIPKHILIIFFLTYPTSTLKLLYFCKLEPIK